MRLKPDRNRLLKEDIFNKIAGKLTFARLRSKTATQPKNELGHTATPSFLEP
jgi:hypothetical protein